jgi:hypothetical protein
MEQVTDSDIPTPSGRPTLLGGAARLADSVNILEAVDAKPKRRSALTQLWKPVAGVLAATGIAVLVWNAVNSEPSTPPMASQSDTAVVAVANIPTAQATQTPATAIAATAPTAVADNPLRALADPTPPAGNPEPVAKTKPTPVVAPAVPTAQAPAAPKPETKPAPQPIAKPVVVTASAAPAPAATPKAAPAPQAPKAVAVQKPTPAPVQTAESVRATSSALLALANPAAAQKEPATVTPKPATPAVTKPAPASKEPDVELINAIMRHVSMTSDAGVTISGLVKQCMTADDIENLMCRRRICDGNWGKSKACPIAMAPRGARPETTP